MFDQQEWMGSSLLSDEANTVGRAHSWEEMKSDQELDISQVIWLFHSNDYGFESVNIDGSQIIPLNIWCLLTLADILRGKISTAKK